MKKNTATAIAIGFLAAFSLPLAGTPSFAQQAVGLTEPEQAYYDNIFNYVMDNIQPDKAYDWKSYSGHGSIKGGTPFASKSKSTCRTYVEDFTIPGAAGEYKGIACKRIGDSGWCHLKVGDMLSCALEKRRFLLGAGGYSMPSISGPNFRPMTLPDINVDVTINGPHVEMPNMPHMSGIQSRHNRQPGQEDPDSKPHNPDGNQGGAGSDAAYAVTDTLGEGVAKGTGAAVGLFKDWFR